MLSDEIKVINLILIMNLLADTILFCFYFWNYKHKEHEQTVVFEKDIFKKVTALTYSFVTFGKIHF